MTKNKNSHPEGCICEQFAHLPYLGVYPNTSDMNELSEIRLNSLSMDLKGIDYMVYYGESNYEPTD
jgi:hypothetical protein